MQSPLGRFHRPPVVAWLLFAPLVAPSPGSAQERTVAGSVLESGSLQPLVGAQVRVTGRDSAVFTNAAGRFVVRNISGDQVTLRAFMIGYRTAEVTVPVGAQD